MSVFDQKAPGIMVGLMKDENLQDFQAAGVLGNIGHETGGFQFYNQIGGGPGVGWEQWGGERKTEFLQFCAKEGIDPRSDAANYKWMVAEARTTEKKSWDDLRATTTLNQAVEVFMKENERPGVPALTSREMYAARAMVAYKAAMAPPRPPVPPPAPPPAPAPKPATGVLLQFWDWLESEFNKLTGTT
jgi:hypothetical protein